MYFTNKFQESRGNENYGKNMATNVAGPPALEDSIPYDVWKKEIDIYH